MQKRRKAIKGNQIIYSLSTVKDFGFLLKGYVGSSNPLEYSCLENPVYRGAWWAAIHRVTQSWTRLKRCSSSNSKHLLQAKLYCVSNSPWRASLETNDIRYGLDTTTFIPKIQTKKLRLRELTYPA